MEECWAFVKRRIWSGPTLDVKRSCHNFYLTCDYRIKIALTWSKRCGPNVRDFTYNRWLYNLTGGCGPRKQTQETVSRSVFRIKAFVKLTVQSDFWFRIRASVHHSCRHKFMRSAQVTRTNPLRSARADAVLFWHPAPLTMLAVRLKQGFCRLNQAAGPDAAVYPAGHISGF